MGFKEENELIILTDSQKETVNSPLLKEPYEMSYEEFQRVFFFPAAQKYKKKKRNFKYLNGQYTSGKVPSFSNFLFDSHYKAVISAVKEGLDVPIFNLVKYRFDADAFLDIRKYCNKRKIKLDNY